MAFGIADTGGVMDRPVTDSVIGQADWSTMSGADPGHPLVGGSAGMPGYGSGHRSVAVGQPQPTATAAAGYGHWRELFNLKGNPLGWVLIASILYLGLMHIHVRGGASVGLGKGR